jgi:hypothetical protein
MKRWPPILWLLVAVGSLLVLIGYNGAEFNPAAFIPGVLLIVVALVLSFVIAFGSWGDRPAARGVAWLIPATAVFYVLCAAAALAAGGEYAGAALGAGLIPLTAATLLTATARAKTVGPEDARRETTAAAHVDPYPGIGMDDATPLGDTPEHSDAERVARPGRG